MHTESLNTQSSFPPKNTEPRPEHPPEVPLAIHDLTVAYHRKPVLWDVELNIPEGKLVGIVGPNGAGKSTLLKACLDLIPKTSGWAHIYGKPYRKARHLVAYVPQRKVSTGTSPSVPWTLLRWEPTVDWDGFGASAKRKQRGRKMHSIR